MAYISNKKFKRINLNDKYILSFIYIENNHITFEIEVNSDKLNLEQISSIWYRRGDLSWNIENFCLPNLNNQILNCLEGELKSIKDYLIFKLEQIKHINKFTNRNLNKLIVLDLAQRFGLKIPNTKICSNNRIPFKDEVFTTKAIDTFHPIKIDDNIYHAFTERLYVNYMEMMNEFFPSLFQNEINKLFEIRIFFINNSFFSMAIFSQEDSATKKDFRKYNHLS